VQLYGGTWCWSALCELVEEEEKPDEDDEEDDEPKGEAPWCPCCGAALRDVGVEGVFDTRGWDRCEITVDGYGNLERYRIIDSETTYCDLDTYECQGCCGDFTEPCTDPEEALELQRENDG